MAAYKAGGLNVNMTSFKGMKVIYDYGNGESKIMQTFMTSFMDNTLGPWAVIQFQSNGLVSLLLLQQEAVEYARML